MSKCLHYCNSWLFEIYSPLKPYLIPGIHDVKKKFNIHQLRMLPYKLILNPFFFWLINCFFRRFFLYRFCGLILPLTNIIWKKTWICYTQGCFHTSYRLPRQSVLRRIYFSIYIPTLKFDPHQRSPTLHQRSWYKQSEFTMYEDDFIQVLVILAN